MNTYMICLDPRLPEVIKVVENVITKKNLKELTEIYVQSNNELIICECSSVLYRTILTSYPENKFADYALNYSQLFAGITENLRSDIYCMHRIADIRNKYNFMLENRPVIARLDNLVNNEEFIRLVSSKAEDGAQLFRVLGTNNKQYFVPILPGFPKINKGDDIGIVIQDMDVMNLLITYNIYKKKINKTVSATIRTLKLN